MWQVRSENSCQSEHGKSGSCREGDSESFVGRSFLTPFSPQVAARCSPNSEEQADSREHRMKPSLDVFNAAMFATGAASSVTQGSDFLRHFERLQGSGGRGNLPGHHAESSLSTVLSMH